MKKLLYILFLVPLLGLSQVKAFPTAEGFGKNATGGRGGAIIHVINLNSTGTGSLREALDTPGARTIVFDVAGDIEIDTQSPLGIGSGNYNSNPATAASPYENCTIAGETAPSPGITIRSATPNSLGYAALLRVYASNVIIRYMTFRTDDGDTSGADALHVVNPWNDVPASNQGIYSYTLENVIIDHCSLSNGSDENFAVQGTDYLTIQNCALGNPDHAKNFLGGVDNFNISIYRNYFFHSPERNPLIGYGDDLGGDTNYYANTTYEFINNVVLGWTWEALRVSYGNVVDGLGNVFKAWTDGETQTKDNPVQWNSAGYGGTDPTEGSIYFADNFDESAAGDNPITGGLYDPLAVTYNQSVRQITNSLITTWEDTVTAIEDSIFDVRDGVGNSIYRDAFDTEVIGDWVTGAPRRDPGGANDLTALIPDKVLNSRNMVTEDIDDDDMLDVAETAVFGSITYTNNPLADHDSNGYTNIEETFFYYTGEASGGGDPVQPTGVIRPFQVIGPNGYLKVIVE